MKLKLVFSLLVFAACINNIQAMNVRRHVIRRHHRIILRYNLVNRLRRYTPYIRFNIPPRVARHRMFLAHRIMQHPRIARNLVNRRYLIRRRIAPVVHLPVYPARIRYHF